MITLAERYGPNAEELFDDDSWYEMYAKRRIRASAVVALNEMERDSEGMGVVNVSAPLGYNGPFVIEFEDGSAWVTAWNSPGCVELPPDDLANHAAPWEAPGTFHPGFALDAKGFRVPGTNGG